MKRFIAILLSLIIAITCCSTASSAKKVIEIPFSVPYNETVSYTYDDIDILIELIAEQESYMDAAHQMAESARLLGYSEGHRVIVLAQTEWRNANRERATYQRIYNTLTTHWHQKEEEYPVATEIWSYLKDLGYSNQVCAGILGNIMIEVGGQTLNIQPLIYGDGYYGMCQWNMAYSEIWGASLEEQCDYLRDTIEYELDTFGYAYKKNFNYDEFLAMTDIEDAALAFAKCYERCGSGSYGLRKSCAIDAYNYFVG